jgi:hypothetical protein
MTDLCMQSDVGNPQSLSERLGAFLRQHTTAKTLATIIKCDIRTAENLRRGVWPIERHFEALRQTYGRPLLAALFWPDEEAARIEEECRELAELLEHRRMAARALAASAGGSTASRAASSSEGFR